MKTQIPTYRARKIDSDEWVEGYINREVSKTYLRHTDENYTLAVKFFIQETTVEEEEILQLHEDKSCELKKDDFYGINFSTFTKEYSKCLYETEEYSYSKSSIFVAVEIDPSTLAIHFPDMIDSEGNKIFASLSEDGRGGDIVESSIGQMGRMFYGEGGKFKVIHNGVETILKGYTEYSLGDYYASHSQAKIKVTGIQE